MSKFILKESPLRSGKPTLTEARKTINEGTNDDITATLLKLCENAWDEGWKQAKFSDYRPASYWYTWKGVAAKKVIKQIAEKL